MSNVPVRSLCKFTAVLGLLFAVGCGEESDRPSDVHTLRVLAVRAETPFAKPGSEVGLEMLAYDGSSRARLEDGSSRQSSNLWVGGCINPPGDSYQGCIPMLSAALEQYGDAWLANRETPDAAPAGMVGWGDRFTAVIPADIISSRPRARGLAYDYGVEIVLFVRCGGVLRSVDPGSDGFPLGCFDSETDEALSRDDFEIGFYPVFVYDVLENHNPELTSLDFEVGVEGESCSETVACTEGSHCGSEGYCIPVVERCHESDADRCRSYTLSAKVSRSSVERAAAAYVNEEQADDESIWISYYGNAGSFEQDARIVNEPHSGWSTSTDGKWRAKLDASREVRLWAVVRDNRNGVAWASRDVWVE